MCPLSSTPSLQAGLPGAFWREPLDAAEHKIPKGQINLIKDRCKSCEFCIEFCPRKILELSDEFNTKGYHPPRIKEDGSCIACRLCELICPEFAIHISEEQTPTTTKVSSHDPH